VEVVGVDLGFLTKFKELENEALEGRIESQINAYIHTCVHKSMHR
jgi:hypothetical protein